MVNVVFECPLDWIYLLTRNPNLFMIYRVSTLQCRNIGFKIQHKNISTHSFLEGFHLLYIFAGYIISHFEVNKSFLYCVFEYFIPLILTLVPLDCQTTYKNLKFVVNMELIDKNQQLRKGHVRHVYFNLFALKTIHDIFQKHFLHRRT